MLPVPHLLLFLPICVFAALFATAAAINIIVATGRPRPVQPAPRTASRSAQIIYFRPRQTTLPSGLNAGLR